MRHSSIASRREPFGTEWGDQSFRLMVDSVTDYAIIMLDRDGRILTWNSGAELINGYRPNEIIGKSLEIFYAPKDRDAGRPYELLAKAVRDGSVEDEGWRIRKDGSRFWADVVITALRDKQGQISGFAKVTRDLTERRTAETEQRRRDEALLRSEERFRVLVEAVEDYAIFMLDPEGRVTSWNSGAERIKGYTASEVIGRHFSLFRLEEDVRAGKCELELEAAARNGRVEEEGFRVRKDGTCFWANVTLTAIRGSSGELLGFAKITRDLTERLRLEEERLHRAHAEEAVRLRDEFLSMASHELRTPLTAVQIELYTLRENLRGRDEKLDRKLSRAVRNADRLSALVESLLDASRISTGKLELERERFDLSLCVSELVDSLVGTADKAECALSVKATEPIIGEWDRLRLEQVVTNIVTNSLKYAPGAPVSVSLSRDGDHAVLEIRDRGPGIPEPALRRIFGRFERAVPSRHFGGLGLGLYLSRQIVEAEGGTITARNLEEGGACFTIRLPIECSREPTDLANVTE